MERRQVTEIPQVKATVTEHQMIEKTCACCGQATRAQAPDGVNAPVQYGPRASALAAYLWHGQFLSRDRACQALGDMFGCEPSPGAVAAMARKIAAFCSPAIKEIVQALIASEVAHFDETGFRVAGKLAWVHSASAGKHVLVTVHAKRGTEGMNAAGYCRPLPGSLSTTPGRPMTPTTASPTTACAVRTSSGNWPRSPRTERTWTSSRHSRQSTPSWPSRTLPTPPARQARPRSGVKTASPTARTSPTPPRPASRSTRPAAPSCRRNATPCPPGC